jgi:hypothetical protein
MLIAHELYLMGLPSDRSGSLQDERPIANPGEV